MGYCDTKISLKTEAQAHQFLNYAFCPTSPDDVETFDMKMMTTQEVLDIVNKHTDIQRKNPATIREMVLYEESEFLDSKRKSKLLPPKKKTTIRAKRGVS